MKDLRGVWLLGLEEGEVLRGGTGKTKCELEAGMYRKGS